MHIRPAAAPDRQIDLARALTAAVAHELWNHCGGNEVVNWLEAERFVASLAVRPRSPRGARHVPDRAPPRQHSPRRPEAERHSGPLPVLGIAFIRAVPD